MDEDLAYGLCRALYDSAAALAEEHELFIDLSDPLFLCDEPPVPLHDGAPLLCRAGAGCGGIDDPFEKRLWARSAPQPFLSVYRSHLRNIALYGGSSSPPPKSTIPPVSRSSA